MVAVVVVGTDFATWQQETSYVLPPWTLATAPGSLAPLGGATSAVAQIRPPLPSTPDTRQDNVDGFVVVKVSTNGVTNGMLYEYVLGRCSCHTSSVRQTIGRSSVRRERIHNEAAHKSRFRKGNTCLESVSGKPKSKWDSFHLDDAMHTHHGSASCHH